MPLNTLLVPIMGGAGPDFNNDFNNDFNIGLFTTTFEGLRDRIATLLSTVTNIGIVQSRERLAADYDDFLNLFKDSTSGRIKGWTVSWEDSKDVSDDYAAFGQRAYEYPFLIRGYLGFKDADNTEDMFNVLLERVRDVLNHQKTFGVTGIVPFSTVVEILHHGKRWFGSVLCHYAEVRVTVCFVEDVVWV